MPHHTWSTCRTCGGLLDVTTERQQSRHSGCTATTEERRAASYLDAIHSGDTAAQARIEAEFDVADQAERTRNLLAAALYYATRWAWPVFPLRPGDKRPLTEHGFKDASRDPDRIRAWWKATPQANIGVPTGLAFDVLDVDWRRSDGSPSDVGETWEKLREPPTALPDIHGQAITARSGLHVLFEPQKGENNRQ